MILPETHFSDGGKRFRYFRAVALAAKGANQYFGFTMKKNPHDEKAVRAKEDAKRRQIDKTGLTSRVRGHVSAAGKRHQGKKDSR